MLEIALDSLWSGLKPGHEAASKAAQLEAVLDRRLAPEFGLQIAVEDLVRVGLGCVRRQVKDLDLALAALEPIALYTSLKTPILIRNEAQLTHVASHQGA